jgi:hypothetical protein
VGNGEPFAASDKPDLGTETPPSIRDRQGCDHPGHLTHRSLQVGNGRPKPTGTNPVHTVPGNSTGANRPKPERTDGASFDACGSDRSENQARGRPEDLPTERYQDRSEDRTEERSEDRRTVRYRYETERLDAGANQPKPVRTQVWSSGIGSFG